MTIRAWFYDDFENASMDLPVLSGNGTITESSGKLNYIVGSGVNCDIWSGFRNCKIAYWAFTWERNHRIYYAETTWSYWTSANNGISHGLLYLPGPNLSNFIYAYLSSGTTVGFGTMINGSWTDRGSVGSLTLPIRIRFVLDRFNNVTLQYYHATNGWTQIGSTVTTSWQPTLMGLGVKTWSSLPACEARYDYFQIDYEDEGLPVMVDPTSQGSLEDGARYPEAGPEQGEYPFVGTAVHLKAKFQGSFEDGSKFVETGGTPGGDNESVYPNVGLGRFLQEKHGSLEDGSTYQQGGTPTYRKDTVDAASHYHLIAERVTRGFFYDSTNERWNDPVATLLTGYARDGYYYISGVKQGSTQAPWATEGSNADRSGRAAFPLKSFIAMDRGELVIYDLDNYPTDLSVWMRFRLGDTSNFYLLGRVSNASGPAVVLYDVMMYDGLLMVATRWNGIENGGLFIINFKATDQNFLHLIRSDGHWWGVSGRTIVHRNQTGNTTQTGVSPSLRIASGGLWSVAARWDAVKARYYIAVSGENASPDLFEYYNDKPQARTTVSGPDVGGSGYWPPRLCLFDSDGWLWFSIYDRLYRCIEDYKDYQIDVRNESVRYGGRTQVQFDDPIYGLAFARNRIFVLTSQGVYQVKRGDMSYYLAYTIAGNGGGGRLNVPPAGELIAGTRSPDSVYHRMFAFSLTTVPNCDYLVVVTNVGGGTYTLLRLYDDFVIGARTFPTLVDPGAWGAGLFYYG